MTAPRQSPLQLYVFPPSPRALKVLAVADHLGTPYELRVVHLFKGDQNTSEYVALNPNQRMPVLKQGALTLWEANAIIWHLAEHTALLPDGAARAEILQWLFWDLAHWEPVLGTFIHENVKQAFAGQPADAATLAKATAEFHQLAAILDARLATCAHVAGGQLTVADFALAAFLNGAERSKIPVCDHAHVARWFGEISALAGWRRAAQAGLDFMASPEFLPNAVGKSVA